MGKKNKREASEGLRVFDAYGCRPPFPHCQANFHACKCILVSYSRQLPPRLLKARGGWDAQDADRIDRAMIAGCRTTDSGCTKSQTKRAPRRLAGRQQSASRLAAPAGFVVLIKELRGPAAFAHAQCSSRLASCDRSLACLLLAEHFGLLGKKQECTRQAHKAHGSSSGDRSPLASPAGGCNCLARPAGSRMMGLLKRRQTASFFFAVGHVSPFPDALL